MNVYNHKIPGRQCGAGPGNEVHIIVKHLKIMAIVINLIKREKYANLSSMVFFNKPRVITIIANDIKIISPNYIYIYIYV